MGTEYSPKHSQRIARPAPIAGRTCLDEIPSALQPVNLMAFSAQQLCACSMEQLLDLFLVFLQGFPLSSALSATFLLTAHFSAAPARRRNSIRTGTGSAQLTGLPSQE